ncbi:MAG TPA: SDR family oxidoreductase [Actinomycetota bacterium]|nr:SDR family oxidoreductase [Actinomycetota bacterium]
MRLENKVAIVSGGGTGIGAATARVFAREGAKVVVTGRRAEPLEAVAAEIDGRAVAGDTSDDDHVRAAVAAATDAFGGLDVVVANAGLGFGGAAADVDDERWQRTLDVNLTGAFRLARAAIPSLVEGGGGSIVLVSSVSALVSGTDGAAYVTSKAAMLGLARSIAVDYGPSGIRANALCPGWVETPMGDGSMESLMTKHGISLGEAYHLVTQHIPLRRPATADEIAACCLFLASDESSIVTGTTLVADGGGLAVDLTEVAWQQERP